VSSRFIFSGTGLIKSFALPHCTRVITIAAVKMINPLLIAIVAAIGIAGTNAQTGSPRPSANPSGGRDNDLSNKALITKSSDDTLVAAALSKMAKDYYDWRNENYPVLSSEAGLHTWDNRLTDYSPAKMNERAQRERALLDKVRAMRTDNWPKDQRIDWILFRAQLEGIDFGNRVLKFEHTNPQVYVGECVSGIF
jgi:hypothetical protein